MALVLLTTQQVIARYFFAASSVALQELEWHLFGAIIFLGVAGTYALNGHVRVDIFYGRLSPKVQSSINMVGILLFLFPAAVITIKTGIDYVILTLGYANTRPDDFYTKMYFEPGSQLHTMLTPVEAFIRKHLFMGELSSNPEGLEARWILRSFIPFGAFLLLLQGISQLIKNGFRFIGQPLHASAEEVS